MFLYFLALLCAPRGTIAGLVDNTSGGLLPEKLFLHLYTDIFTSSTP